VKGDWKWRWTERRGVMEWAVRLLFKLILLVVAVGAVFSFVHQLFSPVEKPAVMAGPGGGRLPVPLPK